jgi:hypothetical protein
MIFLGIAQRLALLKIQYLPRFWEVVYACQPDQRARLVYQFGTLLGQFGIVVYF